MGPVQRAAAALPLLAALGGCWVPIERGRQMEARLARLEVRQEEQARTIDEQVQAKLQQVDKKLKEVQVKLDELNASARASGADLRVEVGRLRDEMNRLKGDLETEQHRLLELERGVADVRRETDTRLASLKGTGALDEALAREKLAELPKQDDKAAVLELARRQEAAGEKGVARELYLHYVKRWPRDERSDDAGYRAGSILAQQGRHREAVLVLGKVAEDFPDSPRAPEALLLVADGLVALERKDDAKTVLEHLLARYPKSDSAPKARARLAELFPPPPKEKKGAPKKK